MNGIGFNIHVLFGDDGESAKALTGALGKTISELWLMDGDSDETTGMAFVFTDGTGVLFYDSARSCCEHRHMTCDDDLAPFIGATFMDVNLSERNNTEETSKTESEYGDIHEWAFVDFKTSMGVFTATQHNEHNGYYGGICLAARALKDDEIGGSDEQTTNETPAR